ncbi:FG-GAP repeat domain-containing protein [Planctomyces sp. SH-PL62]|uniref:FG-GAP repeat domain-containing protein n=1 Tax=Planctomyces sp. SH-PL62 TaxID=1636152 RepID=UPI00078B66D9|nr:VCBS repeat-containing protein [Planctomyces sp. SH-PL62]AMV39068.1 FG-GAP repeat protein [Planctomyces sp. SH-PL62]
MKTTWKSLAFLALTSLGRVVAAPPDEPAARFAVDRVVLDADFPGAYQVEVADVDGDGRPDVIALGGDVCAWYRNPSWEKRVITSRDEAPGVISSAAADLDGDGKAEVAIAYDFEMNRPKRGKLLLAKPGVGIDAPWKLLPIDEVGSIHRLRWGDLDGDGKLDLIVAPIFGPEAAPPAYGDPAKLFAYVAVDVHDASRWSKRPLTNRRVTHAIEYHASFADVSHPVVLAADNEGVTLIGPPGKPAATELVPGAPGESPRRGASEIHRGRIRNGRDFLATIEPWHGTDVVVWPRKSADGLDFGPRTVLDDTLADGHALWVADLDGDGQDEILAGHRGKDHGVRLYDLDAETDAWRRTIVDTDIAAQDLRGGDLDGDGRPDVVAVGGATHNVVLYRFRPQ